jgi:hypothetical protein
MLAARSLSCLALADSALIGQWLHEATQTQRALGRHINLEVPISNAPSRGSDPAFGDSATTAVGLSS